MKLKVFETFSGIGAQHKALENIKMKNLIDYQIVATSEWDVYATMSYASIHHFKELSKIKDPTNKEIEEFLNEHSKINTNKFRERERERERELQLSSNSKTLVKSRNTFPTKELINIIKSFKVSNNIGTIVNIFPRYKKLKEKPNLITYSFPCQDLSTAGNFFGFNGGIEKGVRSGLLSEIEKLLVNIKKDSNLEMPKYLLLENVPNMVSKQHNKGFKKWLSKLENLGYSTEWGILDSSDFGMIQKRRRVYALSYLIDNKSKAKSLPTLEQNIKKQIFYNQNKKQKITNIIDFNDKDEFEKEWSQINRTPSRIMMLEKSKKIDKSTTTISTLTTKQDRFPNAGIVQATEPRFISPKESYLLMGFNTKDYNRSKNILLENIRIIERRSKTFVKEKIYKQAGNSIVVPVLENIFLYLKEIEKNNEKQ